MTEQPDRKEFRPDRKIDPRWDQKQHEKRDSYPISVADRDREQISPQEAVHSFDDC